MTTAEVPTQRQDEPVDALGWLRRALWSPDADVELVPVDGRDPRATWLARPAAGSPELLVPLGSARAAAAVSRRFWDGMAAGRRARQWAGEASLRTGAAQRLWPGRVALLGSPVDLSDPDRSLLARLAAVLGQPEVLAAITARPTHYNGKPVLQLFDRDGRALAFAKVAVDEVSEGYVRTEVEWLARAAAARPPLRAPGLLATPDWRGRPVAVLEPMDLPRLPRRMAGWARREVADAVVALGSVESALVVQRGPAVRAREDALLGGDAELGDLVDLVVDRHGEASVELGVWHGDLSPWNTASRRHEVLVWDWELAGEDMPVGSDLRHETVMVATHLLGHPARVALAPLDPRDPATALYLLELVRRDRQAQRSGRQDGQHFLGDAAADRLRRGLT
ncbi:MAG TPA: hypothetical protein VD926_04980 [Acidimicrobiales bacterium]|nr:hypothetical protein [Acidimicrobiales bacterium]